MSLWRDKVCYFCGVHTKGEIYISICIATDDPSQEYPYTQTDMCRSCWDLYGIDAAIEHSNEIRNS